MAGLRYTCHFDNTQPKFAELTSELHPPSNFLLNTVVFAQLFSQNIFRFFRNAKVTSCVYKNLSPEPTYSRIKSVYTYALVLQVLSYSTLCFVCISYLCMRGITVWLVYCLYFSWFYFGSFFCVIDCRKKGTSDTQQYFVTFLWLFHDSPYGSRVIVGR